jgi:hypothetical protein
MLAMFLWQVSVDDCEWHFATNPSCRIVPPALPRAGWKRKHGSTASLSSMDAPGHVSQNLKRQSMISRASSALGSQAM